MDIQELIDIINTKFSDPKAPGVAVSPPHMPISSAHENSPLTKLSFRVPTVEEFRFHMETNEALDLAYDGVTNIGFDSSIIIMLCFLGYITVCQLVTIY